MTAQDRAYYMRRAEAELALATCAAHPAAMRAHYHLAGFYLDKAYGDHIEKAPRREGRTILSDREPMRAV